MLKCELFIVAAERWGETGVRPKPGGREGGPGLPHGGPGAQSPEPSTTAVFTGRKWGTETRTKPSTVCDMHILAFSLSLKFILEEHQSWVPYPSRSRWLEGDLAESDPIFVFQWCVVTELLRNC